MSFDLQVINGDLVIKNGDLSTVSGTNKLKQDLLKVALTEAGGNPLNKWYGTLISRSLIGSVLPSNILIESAQSQLQNAVESLKRLQNLQVSSGQPVTPDEQISFIQNVLITRSNIDPRLFSVVINVLSRAFGKVSAEFTVQNI
jgi:hypothetical protein